MTQDAPSVICELLPGVTLPHGRSKAGLSLAKRFDRTVGAHAVVMVVDLAVAAECDLKLAVEITVALRAREPDLAFDRVLVGIAARNVEQVRDELGGLAHVELDDRVGQSALEPDHRLEKRRTQIASAP